MRSERADDIFIVLCGVSLGYCEIASDPPHSSDVNYDTAFQEQAS